ncbi:hypothetical protein E2C01_094195 [Portunus trituberculatus]|uniref:Uncharacterized protein n=1 Tax=Portunus trituberculatus TaxID=210409 RepID=A0A5B7JRT9_PORTR|nr:hypothetical protein [Portunus trituberculatus]
MDEVEEMVVLLLWCFGGVVVVDI